MILAQKEFKVSMTGEKRNIGKGPIKMFSVYGGISASKNRKFYSKKQGIGKEKPKGRQIRENKNKK
jgi:hypothetical protein